SVFVSSLTPGSISGVLYDDIVFSIVRRCAILSIILSGVISRITIIALANRIKKKKSFYLSCVF
ncbi:TPA: hypothetical protein ACPZLM_004231, partial [Yersinia enterocolitica]